MNKLESDILVELQSIKSKMEDNVELDHDDLLTIFISDILGEDLDEPS